MIPESSATLLQLWQKLCLGCVSWSLADFNQRVVVMAISLLVAAVSHQPKLLKVNSGWRNTILVAEILRKWFTSNYVKFSLQFRYNEFVEMRNWTFITMHRIIKADCYTVIARRRAIPVKFLLGGDIEGGIAVLLTYSVLFYPISNMFWWGLRK